MMALLPSVPVRLASCLAALSIAATVTAGTITGRVQARAPEAPGASSGDSDGGYGSRRYKFLEKIDYEAMRNFVVSIDRVAHPATPEAPAHAVVTQRDGQFEPHVLPVVVGTEVEWANQDDIFHNVFSMSDACGFDLGLYKRGDGAKKVVFTLPGRVDVYCSIHTKMSCIVLVLPNPWFALSEANGRYTIHNVPAGTYRLKAWHERLPPQAREIVVPEQGEVRADFTLGLGQRP
ncbi:MAG: carboxypeptidase regulatory-like domain-containing protein [Opitutaceae bacterium]